MVRPGWTMSFGVVGGRLGQVGGNTIWPTQSQNIPPTLNGVEFADIWGLPAETFTINLPTVPDSSPGDMKLVVIFTASSYQFTGDNLIVAEDIIMGSSRHTILIGSGESLTCNLPIDFLWIMVASWTGASGIELGSTVTGEWPEDTELVVPGLTTVGGHAIMVGRTNPDTTNPSTSLLFNLPFFTGVWAREIGNVSVGTLNPIELTYPSTYGQRHATQAVAYS